MPASRARLTAAVEQSIVAFVRAGGFAEVAAEAAGVPRATFRRWMRKGEGPEAQLSLPLLRQRRPPGAGPGPPRAEVSARNDKPLDWLRSGPGRETAERPGWTGNARPAAAAAAGSVLLQAEVQALVQTLLAALADHPEARAALAAALEARPEAGG